MKILLISGTDDLDKHKYASFQRTHDLYFLQALSEKKILCKYFEKNNYPLFRQAKYQIRHFFVINSINLSEGLSYI